MADIAITAANVVKGANAKTEVGVAGATITPGQAVYKDETTEKWLLADSDSATAAANAAGGIALNGAALNQPLVVQRGGDLTIGAVLTPGAAYFLSNTPGGICPDADVGAGENVCLLGLAKSAAVLAVGIQNAAVDR